MGEAHSNASATTATASRNAARPAAPATPVQPPSESTPSNHEQPDRNYATWHWTLEGIIIIWNPAAEELFGYSSQDIIGKSSSLLSLESGSEVTKAILTKIRAGQPVGHLETKGVRKNGTVFDASATISPIRDADGAVIGASVIAREMTGKK